MSPMLKLRSLFAKSLPGKPGDQILPLPEQLAAWQRANRRMGWGIAEAEFEQLAALSPPPLTDEDRHKGFVGTAVFYGFGNDGSGHADVVLTAKLAWNYAGKYRRGKTWQCEYVDFEKPSDIRLRPGAPARPRGFYLARLQLGEKYINMTASQLRKKLQGQTGCGPEGFQLLIITHPHLADRMAERRLPFMVLADYDVAPYGFNDFYDAPQIFCSNHVLGLGIGNVDRNYPLFGIPTLKICNGS